VSRKRLPAFARELADIRRRGLTLKHPLVSVRLHGLSRSTIGYGVCLPDDLDAHECDWSFLRNLDVIIIRRGDSADRVMATVRAIESAQPRRLIVLDMLDRTTISILSPEDVRRAAA
jgi:hypothetical protein